jgi:tRNA pseudouridine55 synthase
VNGVLVLDKPAGVSSNQALQRAKRIFGAAKAGHTGSLDPLATGVLPLCFGEATKFSQFLLDADKAYVVEAKLGIKTASGDADSDVIGEKTYEQVSSPAIEQALTHFRGTIEQIPSMYSALKHEGQPLYKLARQGIEIERKPRSVEIYELELLWFQEDRFSLSIRCSKGTYVRNLVEDIAESIDTYAHVIALRRTQSGRRGH